MRGESSKKMKLTLWVFWILISLFLAGCSTLVDINPYYRLSGEGQLAKRAYAAKGALKLIGESGNEVIDLLGEPQNRITSRTAKYETWEFAYYQPATNVEKGIKKTLKVHLKEGIVTAISSPDLKKRSESSGQKSFEDLENEKSFSR